LNKAEHHLYGKENFDFKILYDKNKNYLEAVNLIISELSISKDII